jgi:hypothetical protein
VGSEDEIGTAMSDSSTSVGLAEVIEGVIDKEGFSIKDWLFTDYIESYSKLARQLLSISRGNVHAHSEQIRARSGAISIAFNTAGTRDSRYVRIVDKSSVVLIALRITVFETDTSAIVNHNELVEHQDVYTHSTTNLSNGAGIGLGVGEGLTLLADCVKNEADIG